MALAILLCSSWFDAVCSCLLNLVSNWLYIQVGVHYRWIYLADMSLALAGAGQWRHITTSVVHKHIYILQLHSQYCQTGNCHCSFIRELLWRQTQDADDFTPELLNAFSLWPRLHSDEVNTSCVPCSGCIKKGKRTNTKLTKHITYLIYLHFHQTD